MTFLKLVKKGTGNLLIALGAIFWTVALPTLVLLLLPFYTYRKLISIYAKYYRKDLGKLVTARSCIMAIDDMHGKPECNVTIWFTLKGEVSVPEFQTTFRDRVLNLRNPSDNSLAYPEFRQYYKHSLGYLFWSWDDNFSLSNHIRVCEELKDFQGELSQDHVLKVNEKLLSKPWPLKQSPWEFLIVPQAYTRYGERWTMVLFHLHHGMGDGYTFLKIILNHMAGEVEGKVAKPKVVGPRQRICSRLLMPLKVPFEFSKQCFAGYDFGAWHLPEAKLSRKLRVAKTNRIPISYIKEIKNAYEVSFTAVLFAATAGGMRNYFLEKGIPVPSLMHVFIPMPYPNHPDYKLRNHLSGSLGELPLGKKTPKERLQRCHAYFEAMRTSTIPLINFHMVLIGGAMPRFAKNMSKNYHASGIWSNFPGNEEPIYIAGREVGEFSYNVASLHGRTGFTFTALSYRDHVTIDLTIDRSLVPSDGDAKKLVQLVEQEFDVLYHGALA